MNYTKNTWVVVCVVTHVRLRPYLKHCPHLHPLLIFMKDFSRGSEIKKKKKKTLLK